MHKTVLQQIAVKPQNIAESTSIVKGSRAVASCGCPHKRIEDGIVCLLTLLFLTLFDPCCRSPGRAVGWIVLTAGSC